MGFLDLITGKGMDAAVDEARQIGATLLDVREPGEFAEGHVEGAINIPLGSIETAQDAISDKQAPLFVYCLSGARSQRATGKLKAMGFADVRNIGGIGSYSGPVVTGK